MITEHRALTPPLHPKSPVEPVDDRKLKIAQLEPRSELFPAGTDHTTSFTVPKTSELSSSMPVTTNRYLDPIVLQQFIKVVRSYSVRNRRLNWSARLATKVMILTRPIFNLIHSGLNSIVTLAAELGLVRQPVSKALPVERPFGWKSESLTLGNGVELFPEGTDFTISFTANRISKFVGYIPLVGCVIGISRIYGGIQEYRHFNTIHLHDFSNRGVEWVVRGALESIPVLGGVSCIIIDIAATILYKPTNPLRYKATCKDCPIGVS